jgi:hypothetical protein
VKLAGAPRENTMREVAVETPVAVDRGTPAGGSGASGPHASAGDEIAAQISPASKPTTAHRQPPRTITTESIGQDGRRVLGARAPS